MAVSISPFVFALITSTILSTVPLSRAEIVGCDAANCPRDQFNQTECVLGNSTARAVGISSFNTSLSPQPLTWTLSVQAIDDPNNAFERDFFLGTPPSLDLAKSQASDIQACALFFEGVAFKLKFPGSDPEYDQGTCSDTLTAQCVSDLQIQAQRELANRSTNSTTASVCSGLGKSLNVKAPESCSVASNGQWGGIIARPLTGVDAQQPVRQGACHPTTGKDYDLTLSAASRLNATSRNNKDIRPVLLGITPIMTTVYGGRLRDVEVDLTCLKTVGEKQNTATVKSGGVNIRVDAMKSAVWFGTLATITGLFFGFI